MLSLLLSAATAAAYNVSSNFTSGHNVTTTTEIVTAYTTYCPEPTTFVEGTSTYTVTAPTTLTISDCPCTRTHTFSTTYITVCPATSPAPIPINSSSTHKPSFSAPPTLANSAEKHGLSIALALGAVVVGNML